MKDKWEEFDKQNARKNWAWEFEISKASREAYKAALRLEIEELLEDMDKEWKECRESSIPYQRGLSTLFRGEVIATEQVLKLLDTVTPIE